jgi:exodeoxyribonuclease VII large subunit
VPKHGELVEQTRKLELRLATAARRALDAMRAHWRAAARGMPRRQELTGPARQRFDDIERRLGRALLANARAHEKQFVRVASRLAPSLLLSRLGRTRDRLEALGRRAAASLQRATGPRRTRLARAAGGLSLQPMRQRIARGVERSDLLGARLRQCMVEAAARRRRHLDGAGKLLASLSYHGVLQRGFALVRDSAGRSVRSTAQVAVGQRLDIELADGHIGAQACESSTRATDKQRSVQSAAPARSRTARHGGNQGSLF